MILTRTRDWLGERLPRVTSRGVIILLVGVLALILGAGLAIVSLIGTVDDSAQRAQDSARAGQVSAKEAHDLGEQLKRLINHNHKDRLHDQAVTDRKIRDIICVFISLDSHARPRLLPLLPANYARTQCGPRESGFSPRPQGGEPTPTPGASTSVPTRATSPPRPGSVTHTTVATRTATHTATRTVFPPPTSRPPILDTPAILCAVEKALGLRCTP